MLMSEGRFNGGFNTHLCGIYQIGFCVELFDMMFLADWRFWEIKIHFAVFDSK